MESFEHVQYDAQRKLPKTPVRQGLILANSARKIVLRFDCNVKRDPAESHPKLKQWFKILTHSSGLIST